MSGLSRRNSDASAYGRKKSFENGYGLGTIRKSLSLSSPRSLGLSVERTVRRLRLSRALTVPETTSIYDACQKMAAGKVDALLLTDSKALLCGILTDKDIATRVIARELNLEETPASKVMTRNPVFVLASTLAVEALQKMVEGKFRHLPVVENGEVIALLDIAKCLYDAIARMERAYEKGKAIMAAVEGVEKQWGPSGPNAFIETLRERFFRPSLSTVIPDHSKIIAISPDDTVLTAAKKMHEFKVSCVVVTVDNKPKGILTSKDILMRLIAVEHQANTTLVEMIMTSNPECATVDTPIVDALHTMHDGKFLHLPVVDRDGCIVSVVDVIGITQAAVATVGNTGGANDETKVSMMQKFWDSAIGTIDEEEDTKSEGSLKLTSEGGETRRSFSNSNPNPTFTFKVEDRRGRMHRFICDARSMTDLITCVLQRIGDDIDRKNLPSILYEDEDHDKVVLATDSDLAAAIEHAKLAGWKGLRLHLDYSGSKGRRKAPASGNLDFVQVDGMTVAYRTAAAGAAVVAGLGMIAYLKRNG